MQNECDLPLSVAVMNCNAQTSSRDLLVYYSVVSYSIV